MNQRARFLIELLDKLGAPLMGAVQAATQADAPGAAPAPAKEAEILAALLGQSVQLGLSVAQKLDLKDDQGDADAVRLSLSAMAGRLVGDSYRQHGRVPAEAENARMSRALEAVLTFADNFTPAAEHSARLQAIGGEKPLFDVAQSQIFYLSAMEPVLAAVAEFPFGQNETGLIQDTAQKLQERAATLREAMIGAAEGRGEAAFGELMILHTLARIYADCHRGETARLLAPGAQSDTAPSLTPVWQAFDRRMAMLEALLNVAVPGDQAQISAPAAPVAPAAAPQAPAITMPPASELPPTPTVQINPVPAQVAAPAPSEAPASGGPMGFFAKKPDGENPPAPAEAPPAVPQAAAPATAPETGGSPMAFFKPGAKKEEDSGGQ